MLSQTIKSLIPRSLKTVYRERKDSVALINWQRGGRPSPPPHIVKQLAIRDAQDRFNCTILVETGTFMGDMVEAQRKYFERVYSIELSQDFYERAGKRFENDHNVSLLQGDSGVVLRSLVPGLKKAAIFWLDGHYSGGDTAKGELTSPVMAEITTILSSPVRGHVLLIDDARLFVGDDDYPTVGAVREKVSALSPNYAVAVMNDIICCTPVN